jgi:hypothetical protein
MAFIAKLKFLVRQFPFFYPSKIIYSCQDWITEQKMRNGTYHGQRGPWFETIFQEDMLHHESPKTLSAPNYNAFYYNQDYQTSPANLFYLQNSYLLGHKGLVLTHNHEVFQEFSHHFGIATLKKFLRKNPFYIFSASVKKITGIGAVLLSPESHNYYHWLNDVLPRIRLYEPVFNKIDHFCISSTVPAKFLQVLADFNIPKEKLLFVNETEKLHFDHLYVASLPGSEGRSPKWAVNYMGNMLIKKQAGKSPGKKVYFKRGDNTERKLLNEDQIITLLQNSGFEIITPDNLTIAEQVKLMEQTQLVISVHGAALSNLLFCTAGIGVIELFSPDYFRTDCYYTLSAIKNLNYWYITGNKPEGSNWGDIVVDETLLVNTIKKIIN